MITTKFSSPTLILIAVLGWVSTAAPGYAQAPARLILHADQAAGTVVVVHLQRQCRLAAVHRPGEEAQLGHVTAPARTGSATGSPPRRR